MMRISTHNRIGKPALDERSDEELLSSFLAFDEAAAFTRSSNDTSRWWCAYASACCVIAMRQSSRQIVNWLFRSSLLISCLHASTASSWGVEQLIDEEVISKWKAYERFSRSLQGTARKTIVRDSGKEERTQFVYKQNQNCMSRFVIDEQKSTEYCQFVNAGYAASLKRSKSNSGDFVLERISEDPQGPFPGYTKSISFWTSPEISPHFYAGSTPLSQFVVDSHSRVVKVSKISEKGRELVRLDFNDLHEDAKAGMRSENSGWLILDPSRCWCVLRTKTLSKVTSKGVHTTSIENEVEFETVDHPSGFPLVKTKTSRSMLHTYRGKEAKTNSRSTTDYEWEVNDRVPDSEFTLTAFGLPEPGSEPVKKSTPLYVWILVAAGVCAVLAVGFRHLARRRRLSATA